MKKYLLWFRLIVKRQLNYIFLPVLLAALPVCAFIVSKIPQMQQNSVPRIGIYARGNDRLSLMSAGALVSTDSNCVI